MAPRLFMLRSTCRPVLGCPQHPICLPPVLVGAQSPDGVETAGGWRVSAALSMCTPSWAATVPMLALNLAPKLEQALELKRGQEVGVDTSKPVGAGGHSQAPSGSEMHRSTDMAGGLKLHPRGLGAPACSWVSFGSVEHIPAAPPLLQQVSWQWLPQAGYHCHEFQDGPD